jgi:hypothetical protein
LTYYSGYTEEELAEPAALLLDFLSKPTKYDAIYKKYSQRKFMKGSVYVKEWIASNLKNGLHPLSDHPMNLEARQAHSGKKLALVEETEESEDEAKTETDDESD